MQVSICVCRLFVQWSGFPLPRRGKQMLPFYHTGKISFLATDSMPHLRVNPPLLTTSNWLCVLTTMLAFLSTWAIVSIHTSKGDAPLKIDTAVTNYVTVQENNPWTNYSIRRETEMQKLVTWYRHWPISGKYTMSYNECDLWTLELMDRMCASSPNGHAIHENNLNILSKRTTAMLHPEVLRNDMTAKDAILVLHHRTPAVHG